MRLMTWRAISVRPWVKVRFEISYNERVIAENKAKAGGSLRTNTQPRSEHD